MGRAGKPTQQDEPHRPRFRDRPRDFGRPGVNPYFERHLSFGQELLPADEAWTWRGRWEEQFGRRAPLHLEVGTGNGFFLTGMASQHPERNHLGVERRYKRAVLSARKLREAGLGNARVIRYDAWYLDDLFRTASLDGIYINHPDPWPRRRQRGKRLIGRPFLEEAARLLRPGASLRLKTDCHSHVEALIAATGSGGATPLPFEISARCDDIIQQGSPWQDDVETNYQRKFRRRGKPVYAIGITRQ